MNIYKKIRCVILIWGHAILVLMISGMAAALPQTGILACPTGDPQIPTIFLPIFGGSRKKHRSYSGLWEDGNGI
jgi:hypothetical protein